MKYINIIQMARAIMAAKHNQIFIMYYTGGAISGARQFSGVMNYPPNSSFKIEFMHIVFVATVISTEYVHFIVIYYCAMRMTCRGGLQRINLGPTVRIETVHMKVILSGVPIESTENIEFVVVHHSGVAVSS